MDGRKEPTLTKDMRRFLSTDSDENLPKDQLRKLRPAGNAQIFLVRSRTGMGGSTHRLTPRGIVRVQFDHEAPWIDAIQGRAYDCLCRRLDPRN